MRQCELIGLNRSSLYYKPVEEDDYELLLKRLIDEQYTKTPFYGSRRMEASLRKNEHQVDRKTVIRLMREMGLEAIYPKPNLSKRANEHKIYPYLLRGVAITRPNQVWSADITYIRMHRGFMYLTAIIDWFSRYVVAWRVSNTLDQGFCLEALDQALQQAEPEIFNTDQGAQFTSKEFTGRLIDRGIKVSMDGRGRALDNVFVERLWRSVKYEEVYLKDYQSVADGISGIKQYFRFYNTERLHQSLDYKTPERVHFEV
jgi:putative transposase